LAVIVDYRTTDEAEQLLVISETPLWLLVHVAPIKANNDVIMLILLLFKDITLLKQLIPEQNDKGMTTRPHRRTLIVSDSGVKKNNK